MSAIEAASVGVRTMADGTLRLSVDIEPRFARDAFALFGSPGTPMALAALKTGQGMGEPAKEAPASENKPRRASSSGPICSWLAMRCKEATFQEWVGERSGLGAAIGEPMVANWCRNVCKVESRADIDGNPEAEVLFESRIRKPWLQHSRTVAA